MGNFCPDAGNFRRADPAGTGLLARLPSFLAGQGLPGAPKLPGCKGERAVHPKLARPLLMSLRTKTVLGQKGPDTNPKRETRNVVFS
jgi:hypothetical protein